MLKYMVNLLAVMVITFIYEGSLFAKTLGNRIIYKVISYGKEYSVSRCTDVKGYNAKTSLGYLNVPEW